MKNIIGNKRGGQISFIVSLIMVALFVVALVTFAINFGSDNDSAINIANDPDFATLNTNVQNNLTVFYSDVNTSTKAMSESTISTQTDSTEGGTSFKVGPATAMLMAVSTLTIGFQKIFGSGNGFGILLTTIVSVIAFISIMYIWKTWKGGSPD